MPITGQVTASLAASSLAIGPSGRLNVYMARGCGIGLAGCLRKASRCQTRPRSGRGAEASSSTQLPEHQLVFALLLGSLALFLAPSREHEVTYETTRHQDPKHRADHDPDVEWRLTLSPRGR